MNLCVRSFQSAEFSVTEGENEGLFVKAEKGADLFVMIFQVEDFFAMVFLIGDLFALAAQTED